MVKYIVFPHHLFNWEESEKPEEIVIWEDPILYGERVGDVPSVSLEFNRLRLVFMRAGVRRYLGYLKSIGVQGSVVEIDTLLAKSVAERQAMFGALTRGDVKVYDPMDDFVRSRYESHGGDWVDSPSFILTNRDVKLWLSEKASAKSSSSEFKIQMTPIFNYVKSRIKFLTGVASTDKDNRSAYPKTGGESIPSPYIGSSPQSEKEWKSAWEWVKSHPVYSKNPGGDEKLRYPLTHSEALEWMRKFFTERFHLFGKYEDAVVPGEPWLFHSGLSIPLNCGLLTPMDVLDELKAMKANGAKMTNLEGFTRQLFGWREFARVYYQGIPAAKWRRNVFKCEQRMDRQAWIRATTGIPAVDDAIEDAWKYGYLHHIRRLMVVSNFCTLSEIHPDDVYRWLFEFSLDSNAWTMAFNVYSMGTWSDGGLAMRKPYISSSNYIKRMVNTGVDDDSSWIPKWDGLFDKFLVSRADVLEHTQLAGLVRRKRKAIELSD